MRGGLEPCSSLGEAYQPSNQATDHLFVVGMQVPDSRRSCFGTPITKKAGMPTNNPFNGFKLIVTDHGEFTAMSVDLEVCCEQRLPAGRLVYLFIF